MNKKEIINNYFCDNHFRYSRTTMREYINTVEQLLSFADKDIKQILTSDILSWIRELHNSSRRPKTIRGKLLILRSFYAYCIEENFVKNNPAVDIPLPPAQEKPPRYLSTKDLFALREAAQDNIKNRAIIETLYATGARIAELTNIKIEDISWEKRELKIFGKNQLERMVPFTQQCHAMLSAYLMSRKSNNPYLFLNNHRDTPIKKLTIQNDFKEYSKNLGFKVTPHMLRHTFAATLVKNGMPILYIMYLMGHTDIGHTTEYTKLLADDRKIIHDSFF